MDWLASVWPLATSVLGYPPRPPAPPQKNRRSAMARGLKKNASRHISSPEQQDWSPLGPCPNCHSLSLSPSEFHRISLRPEISLSHQLSHHTPHQRHSMTSDTSNCPRSLQWGPRLHRMAAAEDLDPIPGFIQDFHRGGKHNTLAVGCCWALWGGADT